LLKRFNSGIKQDIREANAGRTDHRQPILHMQYFESGVERFEGLQKRAPEDDKR
jgi:hypothetical protein